MFLLPLEAFFPQSREALIFGLHNLGDGIWTHIGCGFLGRFFLLPLVQVCAGASLDGSRVADDVGDEAATTAKALTDSLRHFSSLVASDDVGLLLIGEAVRHAALGRGLDCRRCFTCRLLDGLIRLLFHIVNLHECDAGLARDADVKNPYQSF